VRDTLSLLDQLMAGSDDATVTYERAVALLGYTHGALLDEVVVAIAGRDAGAAFHAVDRVIQTGQDPRRFVDDLLERLRDLIVVQATADSAASVLHGIPADDLASMRTQAAMFAPAELSRAADVVNRALTEMTGATSPRLHLELMTARVLVALGADAGATASTVAAAARPTAPASTPTTPAASPASPAPTVVAESPAAPVAAEPPVVVEPVKPAAAEPPASVARPASPASAATPASEPAAEPVSLERIRSAWPAILDAVQATKRSSWTVVFGTTAVALNDDVLTLSFPTEADAAAFKHRAAPADSVSEHVRAAIQSVVGARVKFLVRVDAPTDARATMPGSPTSPTEPPADAPADPDPARPSAAAPGTPAPATPTPAAPARLSAPARATSVPATPAPVAPAAAVTDWVVTAIPGAVAAPASIPSPESAEPTPSAARPEVEPDASEPERPAVQHVSEVNGRQRYGEAVVREVLGATFLTEEAIAPRVTAGDRDLFAAAETPEASPVEAPFDPDRPSSADAPDPLRDEY
jgi:DNA polymerase-3 subunit gamma/tau